MSIHDIEIEKKALAKEYKELLRISYQSLSKDDKKLIRKAFDYAVEAHQQQRRKSDIFDKYNIHIHVPRMEQGIYYYNRFISKFPRFMYCT